jgi:hypothetical protein
MNGEVCCILQVCCPPEQRAAALAKELAADSSSPLFGHAHLAVQTAEFLFTYFDLAPAGTLGPLVEKISAIARASAAAPERAES